ncbi:uncharacterized protein FYW35_001519 [Pterocles gutturalis]
MAPAPRRAGFLFLLACCFSSSDTQLLDWIWGSPKTTKSLAAPSKGTVVPEPLAVVASPTASTSPGIRGSQVTGDITTPQHHEQDPGTAVPMGEGTAAKNTHQWDGSATGLVESTGQANVAPPRSASPGQDAASSSAKDLQPLGTGTTEDPRPLGMGNTEDPQLLVNWMTKDPQLLGMGTTEDPQLPGMGTIKDLQLLGTGTTEDLQLLGTGTTKDAQLLGTGTPAAMGTQVSLQRPAGPRPGF